MPCPPLTLWALHPYLVSQWKAQSGLLSDIEILNLEIGLSSLYLDVVLFGFDCWPGLIVSKGRYPGSLTKVGWAGEYFLVCFLLSGWRCFFFPSPSQLDCRGHLRHGPMILRVMPQIRAGWCAWSETVGSITRMFKLYMSQIGSCVLRKSTGSWPCHLELFLSYPISPFEALVSSQNEGLEKHQSPYIKQNSTKEKHWRPRHINFHRKLILIGSWPDFRHSQ